MEEMMRELEDELADCKTQMSNFSGSVKHCLSVYDIDPTHIQLDNQLINYTITNGPQFSFAKQNRFKEPEVNEQIPLDYSFETTKRTQPNVLFAKSQRFPVVQIPQQQPLTPNYDFVKKKVPGVVISESRIDDDVSTQANSTVGPGSYEIKFGGDEKKQSAWPKASRFIKEIENEQTPLNPNYDAVKPAIKVPKITKQIKKTKQLIQREELQKMDDQLRLEQYRKRPLEYDLGVRPTPKGVVIKAAFNDFKSHAPGSRMRKFLIRKLIEDLQHLHVGPGSYETYEEKQPCMVVFRSHSTERRIPPDGPTPGPDYYYSKDDLIKPQAIQVVFGKEERIKKVKLKDLDMRPDLDVKLDLVKPKAPEGAKWDVKETKPLLVLDVERVGPGHYDVVHELLEPRVKGPKMVALNENNDRIIQMDPTRGKDLNDYDDLLYPSLDPVKPAIKTFKYHEPTDIQPEHVPDKALFPEQHKFYDVNLDAVREQLVQDIALAGKKGRGLQEWVEYVDDLKLFQGYMQRQKRQPEVGEYDVNYKQIDPEPRLVNFNRYVEIDHQPIEKPDGAVDGDNLVLNPDKPKPHIQGLDFEKQSDPRPEPKVKEVELDLNVNYAPVRPRVKNVPDFQKQLDRPEGPQIKEQEAIIEPNYNQVEKRVVGTVNIEKQPERDDDPRFRHKVDDKPLLLDHKLVQNKRTAVQMNSKTKRFNSQQKKEVDKVPAAVNVSKLEKGEKAIRPNVPRVNMSKQSSRK